MAKAQRPLKIGKKQPMTVFESGDFVSPEHGGVKPGGEAGQVFAKASDADFDTVWTDAQVGQATPLEIFDTGLNIASGRHSGYSIVNKFGRRVRVDLTSFPQDVWDGGGTYPGLPVPGEPLEFEVFSSSNDDRGELVIQYLENETSEAYKVQAVQVNGTTPVSTGAFGIRLHTARYSTDFATTFNKGNITIRHKGAPHNVFCVMPVGRSQTACAAITIPAGHTGYVVRVFGRVYGDSLAQLDCGLWIRDKGESPRIRRPFSCAVNIPFEERPFGGIPVLQGGDVMIRVVEASQAALGLNVVAGFDIVFIKNK